ncbi:MAG: hypothetical protein V7L30_22685 [Nostoc sp.]|uniref:hypothetical protein n=1 Tax=Nostoc sp. TaxID=1180 RepID=UPI002FF7ED4F
MANTLPPKITHLVAGNKLVFLEDIYGATGDATGISDICGIVALGDDPVPAGSESASAQALVKSGILRRIKVRLAESKKIRTVYIIAANAPQIAALKGKKYSTTDTIKTAYFPQKYTFGA